MGGHGHAYTVPDYKKFCHKGIPELEKLEKALAEKGLCDPWIRNEAWRYNPGFGTKWQRFNKTFFRGLPLGLGLALVTLIIEKGIDTASGGGHGHGHGHGHAKH